MEKSANSKMSFNAGNKLDSTAPLRRRGKEREIPKQKLTTLRKNISKEIEQKEVPEQDEILTKEEKVNQLLFTLMHSKHYREYCRQCISVEIIDLTRSLLSALVKFQDKAHQQNPVKAKARRRLGFGMKEVSKYVEIGKVKCLIIAPDIVKLDVLDKVTQNLIDQCNAHRIPVIFALNRFNLGKVCKKKGYVSAVAVFNYDGEQDTYRTLLEKSEEAKCKYEEIIEIVRLKLDATDESELDSLREEIREHCHIPPMFQCYYNELFCGPNRNANSQKSDKNKSI